MIRLHRLHGEEFVLAVEQVLLVESTPDTTIELVDGRRLMVRETPDEIVELATAYRRRCAAFRVLSGPDTGTER